MLAEARARAAWLGVVLAAGSACGGESHRLGGALRDGVVETPTDPEELVVGRCSAGADLESIDDLEDGNETIELSAGRAGSWFSFNDETGEQEPPPGAELFPIPALDPPRGQSQRAVHTTGSDFSDWGAGVGFDLRAKEQYDATSYAGISFWVRTSDDAALMPRVGIGDVNTSPLGGVCDFAADLCNDHFGRELEPSSAWAYISLRWEDLSQVGWSGQNLERIDESTIYGIRFQTDPGSAFDFWIDDVSFLCR